MRLFALEFETTEDFESNLKQLEALIDEASEGDLVVAPEVCLTGFCYDRMEEADTFGKVAQEKLLRLTAEKRVTLCLTMIVRESGGYENKAIVFSRGAIIYERSKIKLFPLGDEHHYFVAGKDTSLVFEVEGKKFGLLICFELRFVEMWIQMGSVDGVIIMAMWGKNRASHFVTLCDALALTKQAYVVASSSCNHDMAGESGVIDSWGKRVKVENKKSSALLDIKQNTLTRRQIAL